MDPQLIRAIGLKSCDLCWRVYLVGQHHSTNCLGVETTPESNQTRQAIQQMLVSACLLRVDYAQLDFVRQTTWQQVFERKVIVFDRFPKSQSLLTAWSEIFLAVTRQCFDQSRSPQSREDCLKLFFMLPWLLFQRPRGRSTKSPSVHLHERMQLFLAADWTRLVALAQANSVPPDTSATPETITQDPHAIRMRKVMAKARAGDITKATQLLFSDASFLDTRDTAVSDKVASLFIRDRAAPVQISAQSDGYNSNQTSSSTLAGSVQSAVSVCTPSNNHNSMTPAPIHVGSSTTGMTSNIDADALSAAISRSHRAAAGPSGWHISVIKALAPIQACLDRMLTLLNYFLLGDIPDTISKHLQMGSLTALSKPNGGVRPIVTRDTWLRLLSKCIVVTEQPKLASHLPPTQTGVGLQGGTEFVIHTARRLLNTHPSWCLMAIDCTNAYGTVHRDSIKHALTSVSASNECSMALAYFNRFCNPAITIRSHTGASWSMAEGVVQGDPLSPLLFALGLHQTLLDTQATITNASNDARVFAYLDDVYLIGPAAAVSTAFTKFSQLAQLVGLQANPSKSQLLSLSPTDSPDAQHINSLAQQHGINPPTTCITVLGAPVGISSVETQCALDMVEPSKFERLCQVPSKQIRLAMLRHSVATSHGHIVRTLPPTSALGAAEKHDSLVNLVVASLVDTNTTDMSSVLKSEVQLPIRMGGLGLTPLQHTGYQAYLSSLWLTISSWRKILPDNSHIIQALTCDNLQDPLALELNNSLKYASDLVNNYIQFTSGTTAPANRGLHVTLPANPSAILKSDMPHRLYHHLNTMQFDIAAARLFQNHLRTNAERAQFRSKQGFGAGAFLQALPSDKFLEFSNNDFTLALRSWLRLPILPLFNLRGSEACHCRRIDVTTTDDTVCDEVHLLNCNSDGWMSKRHDALVSTIQAMAQSCRLRPVLEPLARVQANSQHRFDIAIDRADSSLSNLKLDITVRNPQAKAAQARAASYFMYVANEAVSQKTALYKRHLTASDKFLPLAFETFGAMHSNVRDLVSLLAKLANHMPPSDAAYTSPTFTAYWIQRLSATLWRENARMMSGVASATKRLTEDAATLLVGEADGVQHVSAPADLTDGDFPPLSTVAEHAATTSEVSGRL
jgi:hypothetical protein